MWKLIFSLVNPFPVESFSEDKNRLPATASSPRNDSGAVSDQE